MIWLSLAFRNLLRNARRSITTVAAVAVGYAAVNIFGGFASYMFASLRDAYIYDQAICHVQVYKEGARNYGGSDPGAFLLSAEDYADLQAYAEADERVRFAAGILEVKGNLDSDGIPGFFVSWAMPPSARNAIQSTPRHIDDAALDDELQGEPITEDTPFGIGVASGLFKNMDLSLGDDVILMSPTVQGQMNATDAQVLEVFAMPAEGLNNRTIFMSLEMAQNLYDTDQVTSVRLLLHQESDTKAIVADLKEKFADRGWEILSWDESADLYRTSKRMFDIIFGLVFAIIITIVTMSVLNTIGMAVIERTTEIGTLRALGLRRRGVVKLFGIESALLGLIGATLGLILTVVFSLAVAQIGPTWEPPLSAREVIWEIRLVPVLLAVSFVLLIVFTFCAAFAPSHRASRQSIVDALGHV